MKRSKKAAILVATVLVVAGLVLSVGSMIAVGFDFSRYNSSFQIHTESGDAIWVGMTFGE